jgi:large subunit ribosomal protein L25
MLQVDMSASLRESFGKGAMRRLRVSGNTPAVLYGNNKDVTSLQLETKPFLKDLYQISRKNAVINLTVDGDTRHVMMREVQTDPVTDSLIHADFFEINLEKARTFSVNIEIVGKAKGVDRGGELVTHAMVVSVEGAPLDIPDTVAVDVSNLDSGESILFSNIDLPDNVKMVSGDDILCVEVISAKAAAALAAAGEAAAEAAADADNAAVAAAADGGTESPEVPVEGEDEAESE